MTVRVCTDLAGAFVEEFLLHDPRTVALAGGSTPRAAYGLLAEQALPWSEMHFFWGDERPVPPDHPESNYRMAWEALLSKVDVPPENIHRIRAERGAARAAADYDAELRSFFGGAPRFDMVVLGLGADGHTASLFHGSQALEECERFCVATFVDSLGSDRVTLTPVALNAGAQKVFLVSGAEKAEVVRRVLESNADLPAAGIRGSVSWLLDVASSEKLTRTG